MIDGKASKERAKRIAKGLPASPGAAVGQVAFDAEAATKYCQYLKSAKT